MMAYCGNLLTPDRERQQSVSTLLKPQRPPWFARISALSAVLILSLLLAGAAWAQDGPRPSGQRPLVGQKSILVLNSYHRGYKWGDDIVDGIEGGLAPQRSQISLHQEYLDTKRLFSREYMAKLTEYLSFKAQRIHYDLVITSDNVAFDFLREYHDILYPDVPVVFCGVNNFEPEQIKAHPLFAGVREDGDIGANIDLIRSLTPDLKRIILVTDRTPTGRSVRAQAERMAPTYAQGLEFVVWDSLTIRELLSAAGTLRPGDVILYTFFFRDSTGRYFEYDEAVRLLTKASPVPVYGVWDFTMGTGIVGGKLTTGRAQGKAAARIALDILAGDNPRDIPTAVTPPMSYVFDYGALTRFGIPESALPPDSVILNKPYSFYQQHKGRILTTAAVIALMAAAIVALLAAISRARAMREDLEKSEAGLRQIIDTIPHAISARDAEGRFLLVNETLARRFGCGVDKITGQIITDVHPSPEEAARTLATDQEVIAAGRTLNLPEEKRILPDGQEIWIQTTKLPYLAARTGEHAVLCVSLDITASKKAEEELRQSQRFIQGIIDSQPSIVVGVDPDCRILYWNKRAEEATRLTAARAQGMDLFEALPRLAYQRKSIRQAVEQRRSHTATKMPFQMDKQMRYEDITVSPLLTGDRGGAVIRIDEVTERVRIEEIMIQTEKMMTVGGMAAGMAHELNNPLGAILQGIQNVERRVSPSLPANLKAAADSGISLDNLWTYLRLRRIDQMLEGIRDAGLRASRIIRNMLDFSRKSESQLMPVDINSLIDTVLNLAASDYDLKKIYDFKRIEIIKDYARDLPQIPVTVTEIEQVLLNLLKNAAHAIADWLDMPHPPSIVLRTRDERDHVRIEVQDNGPGLAPEIRKRVFEPFFTTKAPGVGTGLGLSVSYFIVTQNHHGTFGVRSRPGLGATFTIRLPKVRPVPHDMEP